MNQNLLSRVLKFLRRKMWNKRWQRAVTCFAALVVFCVTYALILPAITMTGKYPVLSAETLTAWTGDELTVRVSAETALEDGGKTVVLTLEGEGADLSEKYVFNDEGVCVVLDEEENEILLHRAIREDAKNTVDYWFDMEPGTKTVFALDLADKVDVTRFAETMEAVKQSGEEAKPEAQKATAADAGKSATAADAGKSAAVTEEAKTASSSNAARTEKVSAAVTASGSNADIEAVNQEAKTSEEKVLAESHDNGFVEILDGQVMNDLEEQENEEATEIVAEMKVSAGIGGDYEKAVADAGKNADKRGDAQLKLRWKDAVLGTNSVNELTAAAEGAVIAVFFDEEAGIPQGAVLSVEEIDESTGEYQEYLGQASAALKDAGADDSEDSIRNITHARFFDITIRDADGNEIEPKSAVKVVVSYNDVLEITEDGSLDVLHFTGSEPEVLKPAEMSGEKLVDGFSFSAETFSVYGIVGTETLTAAHFTADGKTYEVSVKCGAGAAIPKGAKLLVSEVTKDDLGYDTYKEQTAELVQKDASALSYLKMLDISIVDENGIEITPAVPVDVQIRLLDKKEGNETRVIHIGESAEELDSTADGKMVQFATPGFSVFVFVDIDELPEGTSMQIYEDDKFIIKVSYGQEAEIPENAKFTVEEITSGNNSSRYAELKKQLDSALKASGSEDGAFRAEISSSILEVLDMGFRVVPDTEAGQEAAAVKVEPKAPVYVAITFKDKTKYTEGKNLSIAHFKDGEETPEMIPAVLDSDNTAKFETGSFSDFVVVDYAGESVVKFVNEPENIEGDDVHRQGDETTFISHLPYGTAYIDYDLMRFVEYDWSGMTGTHKTQTGVTCTVEFKGSGPDVFELGWIEKPSDTGWVNSVIPDDDFGIKYKDKELKEEGERSTRSCPGVFAEVTFTNVVDLSNGNKADVVVTLSDAYLENRDYREFYLNGKIYNGTAMCGAPAGIERNDSGEYKSTSSAKAVGDFVVNLRVKANEDSGITEEELAKLTFLFGERDLDIQSKDTPAIGFYPSVDANGKIIGKKFIKTGAVDSFTVIPFDNNGTAQEFRIQVKSGSGFNVSGGSGKTDQAAGCFSIKITDPDEMVPLYDADGNQLYFTEDPEGGDFTGETSTTKTEWTAKALYKIACYRNNTPAGEERGFAFYLFSTKPAYTEMAEVISGSKSKVFVTDDNFLYIDDTTAYGGHSTVSLYRTRNCDDSNLRLQYDSGYFLVADAKNGLTFRSQSSGTANQHLTNSNMFYRIWSRTYEGGTISTSDLDIAGEQAAYGVHQPEGEAGYEEGLLAVPRMKVATYDMIPDTNWHIWKVEISDGTEANTSGEIVLRNVTWVDGKYTHTGANGTKYTFIKDADGVHYVFNGVVMDHWITVWWEKDAPRQQLTVIKKWHDNNNARLSRPDNITAYVIRSDGGGVDPDETKTSLSTGVDKNISNDTTLWIKNDALNQWEYTFAVCALPAAPSAGEPVVFKAYESAVPDYTGDAVGADNAIEAEQTGYDPDTNTYQYKATISNAIKNGVVIFDKKDQFGFPVEGARFTLYTDTLFSYPVGTYTSGSDGKVTISELPCGIYYMKETTVPAYHTGSDKVYKVTIHETAGASTIVPGKIQGSLFVPDTPETPVTLIENPIYTGKIKVTKTVLGDEAARSREFDFTADFGQAMANKQITVDKTGSITLDQEGKYTFKLKDGGSIEFSGLPHGLNYTITEDTADGFETTVEFVPYNDKFRIDGNTAEGTVDTDREYTVAYTNNLVPDILIRKTDSGEVPQSLAGSKFKLYKFNETSGMFVQIGEEFEIPADGKLWEDLEPGLYKLEEVLAPTGYVIINRETEFTVRIPTSDDNSCIAVSEGVTWAVITASDTIAIQNQAGVELPATGGPGTTHYTLGGLMLLIISALLYGFRKRHEERRTA